MKTRTIFIEKYEKDEPVNINGDIFQIEILSPVTGIMTQSGTRSIFAHVDIKSISTSKDLYEITTLEGQILHINTQYIISITEGYGVEIRDRGYFISNNETYIIKNNVQGGATYGQSSMDYAVNKIEEA